MKLWTFLSAERGVHVGRRVREEWTEGDERHRADQTAGQTDPGQSGQPEDL